MTRLPERAQRVTGPLRALFLTNTRGAAALEFAFAATLLITLVFGAVEFGRMLWTQQVLQTVAAETARCLAITSPDCAAGGGAYAVAAAARRGISSLTAGEVAVSANDACNNGAGVFTKVTVTYPFATVVPAYVPVPSGGLSATACFPHS